MIDRLGNEMNVGDKVLYAPGGMSTFLFLGTILNFGKDYITITKDRSGWKVYRHPNGVVKVGGPNSSIPPFS